MGFYHLKPWTFLCTKLSKNSYVNQSNHLSSPYTWDLKNNCGVLTRIAKSYKVLLEITWTNRLVPRIVRIHSRFGTSTSFGNIIFISLVRMTPLLLSSFNFIFKLSILSLSPISYPHFKRVSYVSPFPQLSSVLWLTTVWLLLLLWFNPLR